MTKLILALCLSACVDVPEIDVRVGYVFSCDVDVVWKDKVVLTNQDVMVCATGAANAAERLSGPAPAEGTIAVARDCVFADDTVSPCEISGD